MFPLNFGGQIKLVTKIASDEFTPLHRDVLLQSRYDNWNLHLPQAQWLTTFLGAGEEKAVFCICDPQNRVFAVEVLDEKNYLNGRFVGGKYYAELQVEHLRNIKAEPAALRGLTFTGRIKAREFVYGYEWGRFQFGPQGQSSLDLVLTSWLQTALAAQFNFYCRQYKDVHDRNVMFEIRPLSAKGILAITKDWANKIRFVKVGLQAIDVR